MTDLNNKLEKLTAILGEIDSAIVAYSGGADSALLASVAHEVLGKRLLVVIGISDSIPQYEIDAALAVCRDHIGTDPLQVNTRELDNPNYAQNPTDRCYYCKDELFTQLGSLARRRGISIILDGSNADDLKDYRPGRQAAKDNNVRSPLAEAGLTKAEVREISKARKLPTWDKPAYPCLSSRIPYGEAVDREKLEQIGAAEFFLRQVGLSEFRVRHHERIARIEAHPQDFPLLLDAREKITAHFKELGFTWVTLDLMGFTSGSLNTLIAYGEESMKRGNVSPE